MAKQNKVPRTILLSPEAWEILNDLAERDLRKQNSQIEFLIRQAASQQAQQERV